MSLLPKVLIASRPGHWQEAFTWLFYTFIGAVPFWGVALVFWLKVKSVAPDLFVKDAQLAIYSAGLLAPAIPVMVREIQGSPFKQPKAFLGLALLVLIAAASVFGSVISDEVTTNPTAPSLADPIAKARLLYASIAVTAFSVILCFFTELINNIRLDPDLRRIRNEHDVSLASQVRKLLKEQDRDLS
jgi:hypothetical protein